MKAGHSYHAYRKCTPGSLGHGHWVCSNPDHLNLEIALNARSLHHDALIVLRMFDPDLARRVAHHFNLATTFSSASLVASRFAAPATGSCF
jgi:hypothetical protein